MKKSILNLGKALDKASQKNVNGGESSNGQLGNPCDNFYRGCKDVGAVCQNGVCIHILV